MTNEVYSVVIDDFCLQHCTLRLFSHFYIFMWQRFYEHLKLKLFRSTFEIDNIKCNISVNFCIHYWNWQFFMHYYKKKVTCLILVIDFYIYKLLQFLPLNALWGLTTFYALLQLTTFVCTNTIDNFCIDYRNKGLSHTAEQH